ncbi:hypothetical protein QBC45DRAFT_402663 [Copromyces sp. CBS 386.78]|nr:hypothetical protein QBC45DRAFT_402663 [Copromyces sp. CBS 386.78]
MDLPIDNQMGQSRPPVGDGSKMSPSTSDFTFNEMFPSVDNEMSQFQTSGKLNMAWLQGLDLGKLTSDYIPLLSAVGTIHLTCNTHYTSLFQELKDIRSAIEVLTKRAGESPSQERLSAATPTLSDQHGIQSLHKNVQQKEQESAHIVTTESELVLQRESRRKLEVYNHLQAQETDSWKLEARHWREETQHWKLEAQNLRQVVNHWKLEAHKMTKQCHDLESQLSMVVKWSQIRGAQAQHLRVQQLQAQQPPAQQPPTEQPAAQQPPAQQPPVQQYPAQHLPAKQLQAYQQVQHPTSQQLYFQKKLEKTQQSQVQQPGVYHTLANRFEQHPPPRPQSQPMVNSYPSMLSPHGLNGEGSNSKEHVRPDYNFHERPTSVPASTDMQNLFSLVNQGTREASRVGTPPIKRERPGTPTFEFETPTPPKKKKRRLEEVKEEIEEKKESFGGR